MTTTYGIILQYEATNSLVDALTVPTDTTYIVSTIFMCNFSASPATLIIKVAKNGVADTDAHYLYATVTLDPYETKESTSGLTLSASDVVRIQSSANNAISVNLCGKTIYQ